MNLVNLINIICSLSICCGLKLNNKTGDNDSNRRLRQKREPRLVPNYKNQLNYDNIKLRFNLNDIIIPKITQHKNECDKSILPRKKRGLPVPNSQNKLNNDSIKLRLDLNNLLPKISHQRPHIMIQNPITNLRGRPRPVAVLNNRKNAAHGGASQPIFYNSLKNIPTVSPAPPKQNEETEPVISVTTNTTKSAPELENPKFYIEIDDDVKIGKNPDTAAPKSTLQSRLKETVLTKLKEECVDNKKDKNGVIMGIMRELPDMIKTAMTDTIKSEGHPIIIKNITAITLPIQRGSEIGKVISDNTEKEIQSDSQYGHKTEKANTRTDNRHCEEVMNLLLKPILQAKHTNAEVQHPLSHVSLGNNSELPHPSSQVPLENNTENEIESIEIIQNKYSEIVERKHEPIVNITEDTEKYTKVANLVPYTISVHDDPNTVPNIYQNGYNSDSTYTVPSVQATHTTNSNFYNTIPMYSKPVDMYSNLYTPNEIFRKSPYEYSELLQNVNVDSALYKPKCSSASDYGPQNIEANSSDDSKNRKWKTWSNTEIVIKTNHNHADWQNQMPTFMQNKGYPLYNGFNYCYLQNVQPINRNNPCYVYPNFHQA